jgi:hypothetical protein
MKRVVRYLLEGDGATPKFIESGGFFPIGDELIGITLDDSKRYVPKTLKTLSKQDLLKRGLDLGCDEAYIESWLKSIGYSYEREEV